MAGRGVVKRGRSRQGGGGISVEVETQIFRDLPNEVAELCLARLPIASLQKARAVSRAWRSSIARPFFQELRAELGVTEEWLYVETWNQSTQRVSWYALDALAGKWMALPAIPRSRKRGLSVDIFGRGSATLRGNLLVLGGKAGRTGPTLRDVFIYSPLSNRWRRAKDMIITRHSPLVSVLWGKVFVLGGFDCFNRRLDDAECYDLELDQWSSVPSRDPPQLESPNPFYFVGWQPNWLTMCLANDKFYCSYRDHVDSRPIVKLYDPLEGVWHLRSNKMKALLRYGLSTVVMGKLHTLDWAAGRVRVADENGAGWIYLQGLSFREVPWVKILRDNPRIAGLGRKLYVISRYLQISIVDLDAGERNLATSVYHQVPGVVGAEEEEVISCQVLVA